MQIENLTQRNNDLRDQLNKLEQRLAMEARASGIFFFSIPLIFIQKQHISLPSNKSWLNLV